MTELQVTGESDVCMICGKIKFKTRLQAEKAGKVLHRKIRGKHGYKTRDLIAYASAKCGCWHLTSPNRKLKLRKWAKE